MTTIDASLGEQGRASESSKAAVRLPFGWRRTLFVLAAAVVGVIGLAIWRDLKAALVFLGAGVVTWVLVPGVAKVARRWGAMAWPGGRAVHAVPTPLIGGAALFVPIAATLLVLGLAGDREAWGLLAGGSIVFACGLLDDTRGVRARTKIIAQLLAVGALVVSGFQLDSLGVPGIGVLELSNPYLQVACLALWVVLATNAFNLADGADGVATILALIGLGVVTAGGVRGMLPVALAGACLGFLHYNLPRARIFLGDAGSMLLGFLLAALVLTLPADKNVPLAVGAFAYPIGDVVLAVARRFVRGKPLFAPDRSHLHHKALHHLRSPLRALLAVAALAGLQAAVCIAWPGVGGILVCALLWIASGALLLRLSLTPSAEVFAHRKYMRRIHLLHAYVNASLDHATRRDEVVLALRHLQEGLGLATLTVRDLVVPTPAATDATWPPAFAPGPESTYEVHSAGGSCSWRTASTMPSAAVEQERETIVANLLRKADACLSAMPTTRGTAAPVG